MASSQDRFFPELTTAHFAAQLPALREKLERARTLVVTPNRHGLYAASSSQADDAASGYQNAWLRDNALVAFSRWVCGDAESACATARGLGKFLVTQIPKIEKIIARPSRKLDVMQRPHIRFDAANLRELPESWPHAQNDALGYTLWLRFRLANRAGFALSAEERDLYRIFPRYFRAIQFWQDADSGAWEEGLKVNSSSVGAVVAALEELSAYVAANKNALRGVSQAELGNLAARGRRTIAANMPFEAPPERRSDSALLFLLYPLELVGEQDARDMIVSLVRARLMGPHGIRRYCGDSYFCQNYDTWFPPEQRSSSFAGRLAVRDEFLQPGCEAQWCLFDPVLSAIFGIEFARRPAERRLLELQLDHFNRAIAQLDAQARCPELYFLKQGRYVPNEHTPLAWTQANLAVALTFLEKSALLHTR